MSGTTEEKKDNSYIMIAYEVHRASTYRI